SSPCSTHSEDVLRANRRGLSTRQPTDAATKSSLPGCGSALFGAESAGVCTKHVQLHTEI
ncbi:unnamed protein product, partial [Closterium sp. Yama58-4]